LVSEPQGPGQAECFCGRRTNRWGLIKGRVALWINNGRRANPTKNDPGKAERGNHKAGKGNLEVPKKAYGGDEKGYQMETLPGTREGGGIRHQGGMVMGRSV